MLVWQQWVILQGLHHYYQAECPHPQWLQQLVCQFHTFEFITVTTSQSVYWWTPDCDNHDAFLCPPRSYSLCWCWYGNSESFCQGNTTTITKQNFPIPNPTLHHRPITCHHFCSINSPDTVSDIVNNTGVQVSSLISLTLAQSAPNCNQVFHNFVFFVLIVYNSFGPTFYEHCSHGLAPLQYLYLCSLCSEMNQLQFFTHGDYHVE